MGPLGGWGTRGRGPRGKAAVGGEGWYVVRLQQGACGARGAGRFREACAMCKVGVDEKEQFRV